MKRFVHPLLLLLARATEKELVQMIEYLKAENRILRSKLPKQIDVTPAERERLLKLGVRLGSKIKEVINIVHPRTFARWLSASASGIKRRKRGRPRTPEQIQQLILDMAKDTGWGYGRIIGELKKEMRPEFLARLDHIIVFNALSEEAISDITRLELDLLVKRLKSQSNITLKYPLSLIRYIAKKSFAPEQGARLVKKNIQDFIEKSIAEKLLDALENKSLRLSLKNDVVVCL